MTVTGSLEGRAMRKTVGVIVTIRGKASKPALARMVNTPHKESFRLLLTGHEMTQSLASELHSRRS